MLQTSSRRQSGPWGDPVAGSDGCSRIGARVSGDAARGLLPETAVPGFHSQ